MAPLTILLHLLLLHPLLTLSCPPPFPPHLPAQIPLHDVPSTFNPTSSHPAEIPSILNTLSIYPLAIDGKSFASLSKVFTADVITNYSAPLNVLTPLSTVEVALEKSLAPVTTQHAYGTQIVDVDEGGCKARSVSYFTASHFGMGKYAGQVLYAYGQYQDTLVKLPRDGWRIQTRNLVYMGPFIGNLSIFTPQ